MNSSPLTTEQILALRVLDEPLDERCIDWAVEMLVEGFDTPMLRRLAGESAPFGFFEMRTLLDQTTREMGIAEYPTRDEAKIILASIRIREIALKTQPIEESLCRIHRLNLNYDIDELNNFNLLYCALLDLQETEYSFHWRTATKHNIEEIILEECRKWLSEHDSNLA